MAGLPLKVHTVSFGFYVGRGTQRQMLAADQHNEIELNYIERGHLVFRHGSETFNLSQGNAVVYWAAVPHQVLSVAADTEISWLVLPLSWVLAWNLNPRFIRHLLQGQNIPISQNQWRGDIGFHMRGWAEDYSLRLREMQGIVELEVQVLFRRLALKYFPRKIIKRLHPFGLQECHRVQQMVQFMTEHFADEITINQIAEAADLNPEYAMRLFRKNWGITLWNFLLQQRILHSKRLLVLGNAKISDIAFESGFGSISRFYAAFSKCCGCTPLSFRRRHMSAPH